MHLLIDGKNILYRGIYASMNNTKNDHFVAISRMMYSYLHQFSSKRVHVFWDDHKENLWRREILPDYKDSGCREKSEDIENKIIKYQTICEEVWANMNIQQYHRERMEADDLIYAFCAVVNEPITIVSNDSDLVQIIYRFPHTQIFNPSKKIICEKPKEDPVVVKCLDGDSTDNIKGYAGIGPKKALKYAQNPLELNKLFSEKGPDVYKTNRKLIDLSMCPGFIDNMVYIISQMSSETKFDKKLIIELLYRKHKIRGIMSEFKTVISPFKMIGE